MLSGTDSAHDGVAVPASPYQCISEFRIRAKLTTDPGIPCMGEGMQCWSWDISLRDMSAHILAGCVSRGVAFC